jgi:hypothetical protein
LPAVISNKADIYACIQKNWSQTQRTRNPSVYINMYLVIGSDPRPTKQCESKTKASVKDTRVQFKKDYLLEGFTIDLEESSVLRFMRDVEGVSQRQSTSFCRLDSFMNTSSTLEGIGDVHADLRGNNESAYSMDQFTCKKGEALNLREDLQWSVKQPIDESFFPLHGQSEPTTAATCELARQQEKSSLPNLVQKSSADGLTNVETNLAQMLLTKLWIACQEPHLPPVPEDGAEDAGKGQRSSQKSSGCEGGSKEPSTLSQKRARQLNSTSDEDDYGEDGGSKKSSSRRSRGRGPRKQGEFGCPFFKHDPHKHGGRNGCRQYSHENVSFLVRVSDSGIFCTISGPEMASNSDLPLQDHIGAKHVRANDLNGSMWLKLRDTKHLKGLDRYKEIYAILFPGDEAGIRNPCRWCFTSFRVYFSIPELIRSRF